MKNKKCKHGKPKTFKWKTTPLGITFPMLDCEDCRVEQLDAFITGKEDIESFMGFDVYITDNKGRQNKTNNK